MILHALALKLKRQAHGDFRGPHFEATLIVQAVSWYLRYALSYRDIEEMLLERGLTVDHTTLSRCVQRLRTLRCSRCYKMGNSVSKTTVFDTTGWSRITGPSPVPPAHNDRAGHPGSRVTGRHRPSESTGYTCWREP